MFIITKNQVLVVAFGMVILALVIFLQMPVAFGLLDVIVVAASGLAVSLPIWEEHRKRAAALTERKLSGVSHISYDLGSTGFSPVTIHRSRLEDVLVQIPVKAHPFLVQAYRVPTLDPHMTLRLLVNGDQSVIIFQPQTGAGYRVLVATAQLPFVLW